MVFVFCVYSVVDYVGYSHSDQKFQLHCLHGRKIKLSN